MNLNVLVADDERAVLSLIRHTLKRLPYDVETVESGREALASVQRRAPDILVTDIHMPGMSGLELLKAALKIHPDLLAIAITGFGDVSTAVEFMKNGGIDYLQKPVNRDVLLFSISSAADRWRLRDDLRRAGDALKQKNHELEAEITERKRSEKALAASERRYRRIFDGAPVGIFQCDLSGRFLRVNPTLARMFGHAAPQDMIAAENDDQGGMRTRSDQWRDAVSMSTAAAAMGEWVRARTEGFTRDNRRIIVQNTLRTVREETGAPLHIEGFVEDITEAEKRRAAFQREMARARDLYDLVAAPALPTMPGLAIDVVCLPAERVGGDLIDFLRVDSRQLLIFMADVTGHGIPAAMTANTLKTLFRSMAETETDPSSICRGLNRVIHDFILPDDVISFFCGSLDLSSMSLTYALSGLPGPMILRDGEPLPLAATGLPFGVFNDLPFACRNVSIQTGDRLIAVTDGITEAANPQGEIFGGARLRDAIASLSDPDRTAADEIVAAAARFRETDGFSDDVIVMDMSFFDETAPEKRLIVQRFQGTDKCRFRFSIRHIRVDAAIARVMDQVRRWMGDGAPDAFEDLKLAFTEVFINAVEHGGLEMTALKRNGALYDSDHYGSIFGERARRQPFADRRIDVECQYEDRQAMIVVSGEGPGFDPANVADPRSSENRERLSGRGIAIARMNVDQLLYTMDGRKATLIKEWRDAPACPAV